MAKLIDLGLAVFKNGMSKYSLSRGGTIEYMAPEVQTIRSIVTY